MTTAIKPTIQRFTAWQPNALHPDIDGWWVQWKDAKAEIERLQARVKQLEGHLNWIGWESEGVTKAMAEVERLRVELAKEKKDSPKGCFDVEEFYEDIDAEGGDAVI